MHKHEAQALCREHMHRYVRIQVADGSTVDGIIEFVDEEYVYMAVPVRPGDEANDRRGYFPYVPGGFYPPYFNPYYPGGRFRRVVLPLAALLALSLLPFY
jgi:hypothetical protein